MAGESRPGLLPLAMKTVVTHTVTYFLTGLLALGLLRYDRWFAAPPLDAYMRPTDDPWVMAGPLLQPIRGLIFAGVFWTLRESLFGRRRGWLVTWWLLVGVGILSTFGAAPGSVEGMIYTRLTPRDHLLSLPEIVLQSLLLAALLGYWVRHPEKRWLNWVMGVAFTIVIGLPAMGLLVTR